MSTVCINSRNGTPLVRKYQGNPIVTKDAIPYPSTFVSNAGVAKWQGQYVMLFKNSYAVPQPGKHGEYHETVDHGLAFSKDGISWQIEPKPVLNLPAPYGGFWHDPRLTVIGDTVFITLAVWCRYGCLGAILKTADFKNYEILYITSPDNRNMVLFPEKVNGEYILLERPFPVYSKGKAELFDIWITKSSDLQHWGTHQLLLSTDMVPFANSKIGPGAPPVKTDKGWLQIFHSVDLDTSRGKNGWEEKWQKRYSAGIMLLDLSDPSKILGIAPQPIMVPDEPYETENGWRNNVIFPTGMIPEENGELKIYYGAADTVMCLAEADINDLTAACLNS